MMSLFCWRMRFTYSAALAPSSAPCDYTRCTSQRGVNLQHAAFDNFNRFGEGLLIIRIRKGKMLKAGENWVENADRSLRYVSTMPKRSPV